MLENKIKKKYQKKISGKRDSNPQPPAWKADALPIELFPHEKQCSINIS